MKTLFVSLVAVLFAFFVGCQSDITEPVVSDESLSQFETTINSTDKTSLSAYPEVIKLYGKMVDPRNLNGPGIEIIGTLRYSIHSVKYDSPRPAPQSAFRVSTYINAQLFSANTTDDAPFIVRDIAEDVVNTSAIYDSVPFLTKSFRLENTVRPLYLVMNFEVDAKVLTLTSMKLVLKEDLKTTDSSL